MVSYFCVASIARLCPCAMLVQGVCNANLHKHQEMPTIHHACHAWRQARINILGACHKSPAKPQTAVLVIAMQCFHCIQPTCLSRPPVSTSHQMHIFCFLSGCSHLALLPRPANQLCCKAAVTPCAFRQHKHKMLASLL